jgi:hypothetical protein
VVTAQSIHGVCVALLKLAVEGGSIATAQLAHRGHSSDIGRGVPCGTVSGRAR